MKEWLTACGIPTSDLWTRLGVEALMFFLDPSRNVIELFCTEGYEGAADLPRGPARGGARRPLGGQLRPPGDPSGHGRHLDLAPAGRSGARG